MPAAGHLAPVLPLVEELCARGHEVVWHTGEEFRARVEAVGARFTPFVHAPDFHQVPVAPDPGTTGLAAGVSVMRRLFVDRVPGQVADYEAILRQFPAELVIADMCSFGADALADKGGPPYVTVGINPLITTDPEVPPFGSARGPATTALGQARNRLSHWLSRRVFMPKLTPPLNAARAQAGAPPIPEDKQLIDVQRSPLLHLMPTTPAFEYPRARLEPQVRFIGPLLPKASASFSRPAWWGELAGRTVVHVTQGTYATDAADLLRPTIEALADTDVLIVATTPDPDAVGSVPGNARVDRFVPHTLLLPHVDVMVTNAGYNGVLAALAHGVPMVCAGDTEDKANVSARVAWCGAGINLRTSTPTVPALREAVMQVVTEPSYREAARRVQADFATHDAPREGADLIEEVLGDAPDENRDRPQPQQGEPS